MTVRIDKTSGHEENNVTIECTENEWEALNTLIQILSDVEIEKMEFAQKNLKRRQNVFEYNNPIENKD